MKRLRKLIHDHPISSGLFALALLAMIVFAVRLGDDHRDFRGRDGQPPALADWMTPGMVIHTWHLKPEVLLDAIDLPRETPRRSTLRDIAEARGVPVETIMAEVQAVIDAEPKKDGK
mgnify:CR=1 FL=1